MKTIILLLIITCFSYTNCQINEADLKKSDLLVENYRDNIDSTIQLSNGAMLYYFSDSLFNGKILNLKDGMNIELDLRYNDENRGYVKIGEDFKNHVLIEYRGQGSGNPSQLLVVNKLTGESKWFGDYPFYFDRINETIIYNDYKDTKYKIIIYNFYSDNEEEYLAPESNCHTDDCYEIIKISEDSFTLRYYDNEYNFKEIEIFRKK